MIYQGPDNINNSTEYNAYSFIRKIKHILTDYGDSARRYVTADVSNDVIRNVNAQQSRFIGPITLALFNTIHDTYY